MRRRVLTGLFLAACLVVGTVFGNGGWASASTPPPPPTSISLAATKTTLRSDQTSTLTATASSTLTGTGFFITIFDKTSGARLAACGSGTTCAASVQILNGGPHKYVAYVGDASSTLPPTRLKATSNIITITRAAWTVTLTTTSTTLRSDESATLTATANQPVTSTGYYIMIFDQTTGARLAACGGGTTCSTSVQILNGGAHTYIAYVGDAVSSPPPANVQATSGTLTISRAVWTVSLSSTATTLRSDESATLTATANQPVTSTGYYVMIFDQTSGARLAACGGGTTCTASVQILNGGAHTYIAYVGDAVSSPPPTNVQATSSTVTVQRAAWLVGLTTTATSLKSTEAATLTATANQPVTSTGYYIMIFDQTTGARLAACGGGATCTASVQILNGGSHTYIAYVGDAVSAAPPTNLQATSSTVTIQRTPYTVGLTTTDTELTTSETATLTATANQPVTSTGYYVMIFDQTTGARLAACGGDSTCSANVRILNGDPHRYIAYVGDAVSSAPPTSLQATSGAVTIHRAPWSITLSSSAGSLIATANQVVDSTGYSIMIFDQTTGARWAACGGGATCSTAPDPVATAGHVFIAYVGNLSSTAPPPGEQANSNGYGFADNMDLSLLASSTLADLPLSQVCDELAFLPTPPATHVEGSTVNDEEAECLTVEASAGSTAKALSAVATTTGGAAAIYWLAHQFSGSSPATTPAPTAPDPNAPADPAPDPLPIAWPADQLANQLMLQNPGLNLTPATSKTIARQCLWRTSAAGLAHPYSQCMTLPIFATGADVAEATMHDAEAIQSWPHWIELNYEPSGTKSSSWRDATCQELRRATPVGDCDEYPFLASMQGGGAAMPTPSLKIIDSQQNQLQGSLYGAFTQGCLARRTGATFLVIPLVELQQTQSGGTAHWVPDGLPTMSICNHG